jgi:hypothetical protein
MPICKDLQTQKNKVAEVLVEAVAGMTLMSRPFGKPAAAGKLRAGVPATAKQKEDAISLS